MSKLKIEVGDKVIFESLEDHFDKFGNKIENELQEIIVLDSRKASELVMHYFNETINILSVKRPTYTDVEYSKSDILKPIEIEKLRHAVDYLYYLTGNKPNKVVQNYDETNDTYMQMYYQDELYVGTLNMTILALGKDKEYKLEEFGIHDD